MKIRYAFLGVIFSCGIIFAQGQTAVPFLLDVQSPLFYGAGGIGAAVPMQDPLGFYYNPAQLGWYSRSHSLSVFFMPVKTTLFNSPTFNAASGTFGFTLGYNFLSNGSNLPLSIGAGFIHNNISYNYSYIINYPDGNGGIYKSEDSYDCYSFGASYNYYVLFNAGFSLKSFNSNLAEPESNYNAAGTAFDFGAMVIAPFDDLFLKEDKIQLGGLVFSPVLKASAGYSITNIGKKIYYVDPAQSDPIPRTARLGYNINLGFNTKIAGTVLPVVDYSFTAEAEDMLVNDDSLGNVSYQGMFGNINIGNNLILLKPDKNVVVHKGHIFNFFKTLTVVSGSISASNLLNVKTSGWAVSSEGLFKVLAGSISNPSLNYIFRHFGIEYYKSSISAGPLPNQEPSGFALYFYGIDL